MEKRAPIPLWVINIALAVSLIGGWFVARPATLEVQSRADVTAVSYVLESWVGSDVALDPFEEKLFGTGRVVKRGYIDQSAGPDTAPEHSRIGLLAVQTFGDRHAHHPPEYCYTGSGWEVHGRPDSDWELEAGSRPVSIMVERTSDDGKPERELVLYWFTDGERFATSYAERTIYDAWDRLRGEPKSWVLVRISKSLPATESIEVAETHLRAFSSKLHGNLAKIIGQS
ncbi:MAG: EpsI family protein [Gammaproteobacteria bacterium]|nr:EpsI family protein [Gammaproteobacteria bacterium]